jgi:polygalacturonase
MHARFFACVAIAAVLGGLARGAEPAIDPIAAPFAMPQLQRPRFPDSDFPITAFGGRADADASAALAAAIAACAESGGGRVIVPAGRWRSGPIHLKSRVHLHLQEGSEIVFSGRFEDYLPPVFVRHAGVEIVNYSPLVYARGCEDVAITGPGILNGNAERWWDWKKKETRKPFEMPADASLEDRTFGTVEAAIRPSFLVLLDCRNVLLEGFTITSGPNWTIHPTYCENVVLRGLTVDTHGPNNDGIDVDSCRNVLIEDCSFKSGDDCVVLKSGYNQDGRRVGRPTEKVVMRRCRARNGHGGLVVGSEMSGDVRDVFMHDCEFDGTDHILRIKSRIDRGGVVERIHVDGVRGRNLARDVVLLTMDYTADRIDVADTRPPIFRDIHVRNVSAESVPLSVVIQGLKESPIRDCHFSGLRIDSTKGMQLQHVENLSFDDCTFRVAEGPAVATEDARGLTFRRAIVEASSLPQFTLGEGTACVELLECRFAADAGAVAFGPTVPSTAVTIR